MTGRSVRLLAAFDGVRALRTLAYPLKLASVRIARRAPTALLAAAGVAAGAAMIATVLAGTVVAKDESVGRAIEEIPAAQRAVRAGWFGIPAQTEGYSTLDESARKSLAGATTAEPSALVLYRESTIAGRYIGLGAVDGLDRWVTLRSGRLPRTCEPERCEVVRLRGAGSLPNVEGLRLVEVGTAAIRSPVLFGDFVAPAETERARAALSPFYRDAIDYHRPAPPPLVLAEGVEGLVDSPELENVYRSYAWVVPLGPGDVRAWNIDGFAEDVAQARTSFQNTSFAADLTAPLADLQSASESSEVAGRRLLLVGGESAALLFAFAILAAVSMRRDTEAARRRLTWFGARRWQLSLFTGTEAAAVAVVGTAVGWALGTAAGAVVASRAGAPVGEVLAHSTLSSTGLLVAAAVAGALALVLVAALRAKPIAFGRRSFSALDAAALGAVAVIAVTLLRGDLDQETLAQESGTAAALVLLPGLVTFVAAVICARLLRPGLLLLERASRGRSVGLRLAALSLARHPGHAAVAAAFLVVSVGLAVFAESYRSTLARGQEEQAAYAVPLDFTLREDLTRLIQVNDAAPPERLAELGEDVRVEPVLRLSGNVSRAGGRTGITILGLDPEAIPALRGWRDDFSAVSPATLASRVETAGDPEIRGPMHPRRRVAARGRRPRRGRGPHRQRADAGRRLRPPRPGRGRAGRLDPPCRRAARGAGRTHRRRDAEPAGQGPGARRRGQAARAGARRSAPSPRRPPAARSSLDRYEDWIGVNGIEPVREGTDVRAHGSAQRAGCNAVPAHAADRRGAGARDRLARRRRRGLARRRARAADRRRAGHRPGRGRGGAVPRDARRLRGRRPRDALDRAQRHAPGRGRARTRSGSERTASRRGMRLPPSSRAGPSTCSPWTRARRSSARCATTRSRAGRS